MPITIPHDIIDIIITFIDNPRDLRECALVCRAWTRPSQQSLFDDITILLEPSPSLAVTSTGRLRSVLHTSPHLAGCVRGLTIGYADGDVETTKQEQQLLSTLIPTFSRLLRLSLVCDEYTFLFDLDTLLTKSLRTILSSPRLTHVTVSGWAFEDVEGFVSVMGTHVNDTLSTLVLGHVVFYDYIPSTPKSRQGPPVLLDSLAVHMSYGGAEAWFKSLSHPLAVRRLHLGRDWEDIALSERFSAELEELSLAFPMDDEPVSADFSNMRRLSKLTVNFSPESVLQALLDTLPDDNCLQTLEFLDVSQWGMKWFREAFKFLDDLLVSRPFPCLTKLLFHCWYRENGFKEDDFRFIQRYLGRAVERGVVYLRLHSTGEVFDSSYIREQVMAMA